MFLTFGEYRSSYPFERARPAPRSPLIGAGFFMRSPCTDMRRQSTGQRSYPESGPRRAFAGKNTRSPPLFTGFEERSGDFRLALALPAPARSDRIPCPSAKEYRLISIRHSSLFTIARRHFFIDYDFILCLSVILFSKFNRINQGDMPCPVPVNIL